MSDPFGSRPSDGSGRARSDDASRNRLLATLSADDLGRLTPQFESVDLPVRAHLLEPNGRIDHIFFPVRGIVSVVAATPQGRRIEVGIVGCEGLTGMSVLLGADRTPHECFLQMAGAALRIRADALRQAIAASVSLHEHLLRFVQTFMIQTAQTALANGSHVIEERLARWLLMCHDRVQGDDLFTTHEFLSVMLGVRRAGVTEALRALETRGIISCRRGQVTVLGRSQLEATAGDSYGVPETEYARLIGLPLSLSPARSFGPSR